MTFSLALVSDRRFHSVLSGDVVNLRFCLPSMIGKTTPARAETLLNVEVFLDGACFLKLRRDGGKWLINIYGTDFNSEGDWPPRDFSSTSTSTSRMASLRTVCDGTLTTNKKPLATARSGF